ncbi:hypothetical protein FHR92_005401 [Fontibacillus solani]|uniref:DNA (cytosine-5-)-methyltransferase n=1 Tax=Fontibacillus solani TaxID=1572857 RepID=A0A7W3SZ00_9BACL|nr:hypothetical protein [Fontibacillus solani]MBA9088854.1 hypothetical protein [Fontibacillus solani]
MKDLGSSSPGLWATPNAADAVGTTGGGQSRSLRDDVRMWPTPNNEAWKDRGGPENPSIQRRMGLGKQVDLQMTVQGQLNPDWVEALMCVPEGWTDIGRDVELPQVFNHPSEYISYIHGHPQPALMGQPQHNWEPPRVASGVKGRVPRLKMLGNGVVPLQILPIVAIIAMIELDAQCTLRKFNEGGTSWEYLMNC